MDGLLALSLLVAAGTTAWVFVVACAARARR
jgi:hypothetical protein